MPTVKLKKGFVHNGVPLQAGDEFTGDQQEIDALVRQGYADAPKSPPEKPAPPPVTQVTLTKGFMHNGHQYNAGDEFEGSPDEIDDLVRQGYADDPNQTDAKSGGPGPGAGVDVSASSSSHAGVSQGQGRMH